MIRGRLHDDRVQRAAFCALVAMACGTVYFYIGYLILGSVHPFEDAYILFRYAENLAAGNGIVFNIGGPRTEGATDFLWLLGISGGVRLGADVALVALMLNALGASLAGWLLGRCCWGTPRRPYWVRALLCVVLPSTLFAGGALAGYGGFSSMLYSALILLLFAIAVEAQGRGVLAIPVLGLTVSLFRPDGVVVGVVFVLLATWTAWAARQIRGYMTVSAACAVAGAGYFVWRYAYFGLWGIHLTGVN